MIDLDKILSLAEPWNDWIYKEVRPHALCNRVNLIATAGLTRMVIEEGIEGCFIECGVGAGVHPIVMARVAQDLKSDRIIWLADGFQGIPKAGPRDGECAVELTGGRVADGVVESSGVVVQSEANVRKLVAACGIDMSKVRFLPGWFQDTLEGFDPGPVAFLRVDVDIYDSTEYCFRYVYPNVVASGLIVEDDFGFGGIRELVEKYTGAITDETKIDTGCFAWRRGAR